jgi:heme o synthase
MTLVLIVVGAIVRASGSGLGCPDWPRCYGSWIPPLRATALIEYSHRLTASVVGALVLYVAILAWLKHRSVAVIFWPSFLALVTVIVQAGVGRQVVLGELPKNLVVVHFFLSLALLGLLTLASANASNPRGGHIDTVAGHSLIATGVALVTLVAGAFVVQWGASGVFPDWPLMNGSLAPPEGGLRLLHYFHRFVAALLGLTLGLLAIRISRRRPKDRTLVVLGHGAFFLWLAQVLLGGANVLTGSAEWTVVAHVLFGALLWVSLVNLSVITYRRAASPFRAPADPPPLEPAWAGPGSRIKAYFMLTKPRIIELLMITTVPAMIVAEGGWPSVWLIIATLVGGSLAAGSANAINCYLDRDIDEKMRRTSSRPLPSHQVEPSNALRFGIVMGLVSALWLAWTVNQTAAALACAAILFYVFVYTIALKRSTPSNIVIGGAAGAAPVLVGWAAVTGSLGRFAWVLFAIIFYWTPPHFWALALRYSDEYAAAKVPMLPVVQGVAETTRQIFLYSVVLFAVSLLAYPVGNLGIVYLLCAVVLGAVFIGYARHLRSHPDPATAMGMFRYSISYLVLLFVALAVDRLIEAPGVPFMDPWVLSTAAGLFAIFECAILISVLGYRGRAEIPGGARLVAVELAWTVLPVLLVGALFLLSWQPAALAAP